MSWTSHDSPRWPVWLGHERPCPHSIMATRGKAQVASGSRDPGDNTPSISPQVNDPLQKSRHPRPQSSCMSQAEDQPPNSLPTRHSNHQPQQTLTNKTESAVTSYSTMAFFILSTSKIILMRSCTGLGSLDLVPGFTVSFFTASSSFREKENQEGTQLNNLSKVVVVFGRERTQDGASPAKKKKLSVNQKGLALVARRSMYACVQDQILAVHPSRSSWLLQILTPDATEASSSVQADPQAPTLPSRPHLLPHCLPCRGCWCPVPGNLPGAHSCPTWKCWAAMRVILGPRGHWTDGQILSPFFSCPASPKTKSTQHSL